jgi:membrane fusion protein (multidrug efflux system)
MPVPFEVPAVTITPRDVPIAFEFIARTQSSRQVSIQARVEGFLEKRLYTEGSIVEEGDILFLMDSKPSRALLAQAEAALEGHKAAYRNAQANLDRVKPLTTLKVLSQKDLDDAVGQFHTAEARVAMARAQVESARLNLSYTTITSPVSGITGAARQAEGTYVNQQNSLLTTVSVFSPIWVNFSISDNQMQKILNQVAKKLLRTPKNGEYRVEVLLAGGSIFPHTGRITFTDPTYDAQTGTFLVRASIDNPEGQLCANQYVRTRVKGAIRPDAILVPQRAVQQGPKGHFVWVINREGKAEVRPVDVGDWHESDWFIDEGLKAGEQVVVEGILTLHPGMPVSAKPYGGGKRSPEAETADGGR